MEYFWSITKSTSAVPSQGVYLKGGERRIQQGTKLLERECYHLLWAKHCCKEQQRWESPMLIKMLIYLDVQTLPKRRGGRGELEKSHHFPLLFWRSRPKSTQRKKEGCKALKERVQRACCWLKQLVLVVSQLKELVLIAKTGSRERCVNREEPLPPVFTTSVTLQLLNSPVPF